MQTEKTDRIRELTDYPASEIRSETLISQPATEHACVSYCRRCGYAMGR